jgi:hypothetical protein
MCTAELGRGREGTGKSRREIVQQPPHLVSTLPTPRGVVQGSCWILKSGAARESHSTPTNTPLIAFPVLNPILFYCDLRDFVCYFIKAPSHPPARQTPWAQNLRRCKQQDMLRVYTVKQGMRVRIKTRRNESIKKYSWSTHSFQICYFRFCNIASYCVFNKLFNKVPSLSYNKFTVRVPSLHHCTF